MWFLLHRFLLPIFLCLAACDVSRATLRMVCKVENRMLPLGAITDEGIWLVDGNRYVRAPKNPEWVIEGEFRENAAQACWSPRGWVERPLARDGSVDGERSRVMHISVAHWTAAAQEPNPKTRLFTDSWPDVQSGRGLLVFGRAINGHLVQSLIREVPDLATTPSFTFESELKLAPDAPLGGAVMLFWHDGRFTEPRAMFSDPLAQRAYLATVTNDVGALGAAIADGASIEARAPAQETLAHFAAAAGALDTLDFLLTRNPSLAQASSDGGKTALHWAASSANVEATSRLLKAGADPNACDTNNWTPIDWTRNRGATDVVRALLKGGARLDAGGARGEERLTAAIARGYTDIAELFLETQKLPDGFDHSLHWRCAYAAQQGYTSMLSWLVRRADNANLRCFDAPLLVWGAERGSAALARGLLDAGASLDTGDDKGVSALMCAAAAGNVAYAEVLLEAGADLKQVDRLGMTALHHAARSDCAELVHLLLDRGAELEARTLDGSTPLHAALDARAITAVEALTKAGARLSPGQLNGQRTISAAIEMDVAPLIAGLLAAGWSPDAVLPCGLLPADLAALARAEACARILEQAKAPHTTKILLDGSQELDHPAVIVRKVTPTEPRRNVYDASPVELRLSCIVLPTGEIVLPQLLEPSPPIMRGALFDVLPHWQVMPAQQDGTHVAMRTEFTVTVSGDDPQKLTLSELSTPVQLAGRPSASLLEVTGEESPPAPLTVRFDINVTGTVDDVLVLSAPNKAIRGQVDSILQQTTFTAAERTGKKFPVRVTGVLSLAPGGGGGDLDPDSLLLASVLGLSAGGLVTYCEIDGKSLVLATIDRGTALLHTDGAPIPVPTSGTWTLEGEIPGNVHWLRSQLPWQEERPAGAMRRYRISCDLNRASQSLSEGRAQNVMDVGWPGHDVWPAILLAGWMHDGRILQTRCFVLSSPAGAQRFPSVDFLLTKEETHGIPVAWLWARGNVIPPRSQFGNRKQDQLVGASVLGDTEQVRQLVRGMRAAYVAQALGVAVESGQDETVSLLLDRELFALSPFQPSDLGLNLARAVSRNYTGIARALLRAGADVNHVGGTDMGALGIAVAFGHRESAELLIHAGADVRARDERHRLPIDLVQQSGDPVIMDLLLAAGSPAGKYLTTDSETMVRNSARGQSAMVAWMLQHGGSPNVTYQGTPALIAAVEAKSLATARVLLDAGANIDLARTDGSTALSLAARGNDMEIAAQLLEAGASINHADENGLTPLHYAARANATKTLQLLLEQGADRDARDASGATALERALTVGARDTARQLIAAGARLRLDSDTFPKHLAAAIRLDLVALLETAMADGWKPGAELGRQLHPRQIARGCAATECVEFFGRHGALAFPDLPTAKDLGYAPTVVKNVHPIDPRPSQEIFPAHQVVIEVMLDAHGRTFAPEVVSSPDPMLIAAALEAVQQMQFTAPLRDQRPSPVRVQVTVEFPSVAQRIFTIHEVERTPRPKRVPLPANLSDAQTVSFDLIIDREGAVREAEVVQSQPGTDRAELVQRIREAQFAPGSIQDKPVVTRMRWEQRM